MKSERKQVLDMLVAGKINAEEAEKLLETLEQSGVAVASAGPPVGSEEGKPRPRYLRVQVREDQGEDIVNIRVPLMFLRAGMKLASFVPGTVFEQVQDALHGEGIQTDLRRLKPEEFAALVEQLEEIEVNVESEGARVRVYCE